MEQSNEGRIIAVYKPAGMTSHDVVDAVRASTGVRRVGHAGTLDPLASGVLVVGIGRDATKELSRAAEGEKEYMVMVELGTTSTTDDAEGEKTAVSVAVPPSERDVQRALEVFIGEVQQTPPVYSAVHVKGKRSYKLARKGKPVAPAPRSVFIHKIELLEYAYPLLKLRVVCGKGTYIRSLARDIGAALGTGGFVRDLERARVGSFTLKDAVSLDAFAS